jgi:hypothetical protein
VFIVVVYFVIDSVRKLLGTSSYNIVSTSVSQNIYTLKYSKLCYIGVKLSVVLKEECRVMLTENKWLRLFRLKTEKAERGCRKWNNEELHNLHPSPNIIKVIK